MKALVVGAGSIGRRHIDNLHALGIGELGVYDAHPATQRAVAADGIRTFDAYAAALDWQPDVALICSPSHLHLGQASDLLEVGAHVFVEKPLSHSWEGIPEFLRRADASDRVVQVGYNLRFHPAVRCIQENLAAGKIGTAWLLRARFGHYLPQWRPGHDYRETYAARVGQGGGVLMDCIHEVDYLLSWGGDVAETRASLARVSDLEIDGEDYATVFLRFASGAVGEVRADYLRYDKVREAEVIGSAGMLVWESQGRDPEAVLVRFFDPKTKNYTTLLELAGYDPNEMYVDELRHFLGCVRGEGEPLVTAREAARSLAIVLEARGAADGEMALTGRKS